MALNELVSGCHELVSGSSVGEGHLKGFVTIGWKDVRMSRGKPGLLTHVGDCGNLQAGSALIPGATG